MQRETLLFTEASFPTSTGGTPVNIPTEGTEAVSPVVYEYVMPAKGHILGIVIAFTGTRGSGTWGYKIKKNGSEALGAQNLSEAFPYRAEGEHKRYEFTAGDKISLE